jgi:hypothetical protein
LAVTKFAATFGWAPPDWRQSTEEVVVRLVGAGATGSDTMA